MNRIQQLSIFVENKMGQITDVTKLLASNNLSIKSINLVDSTEFGILRVIVDDPFKAKNVLDANGISLKNTEVFAVEIDDHIGSFDEVVSLLTDNNINIEYTYTINTKENGAFIFKVTAVELEKTLKLLEENGIKVLGEI